jgi:phosphate transport system substrate-binding protein
MPCPDAPQAPRFGIHGSNTIGERLMPMLIEAYGKKRLGVMPTAKLTAPEEQEITLRSSSGTRAIIDLHAHGSGTAAPALIDGSAAIGMASRQLNPDEVRLIDQRFNVNVLAPGNEHVLALDGLAVIVNPANPIKQMDLCQIARVFSGQIPNWRDIGGADRPIKIFRRDDKSGTYDTFKALVLAPCHLNISPQAQLRESSETLTADVARDPDAIGFIGLPYINRNVALSISSSCGISSTPSKFSVKTEEYPLARRLYLYTVGAPSDPTARELLQFALSDEAQFTVQEAEFVDQAVGVEEEAEQRHWAESNAKNPTQMLPTGKLVPNDAVQTFQRAMGNSRRSSIVFRFEPGSAHLDTKALQDIGRLSRYLSSPVVSGKQFYIVGFADATGGWAPNRGARRGKGAAGCSSSRTRQNTRLQGQYSVFVLYGARRVQRHRRWDRKKPPRGSLDHEIRLPRLLRGSHLGFASLGGIVTETEFVRASG